MSLPAALEHAAASLPRRADAIRPANGDPGRLLAALDAEGAAEVMAWLLANEPEAAEELGEAWEEEAPGVEAILRVPPESVPKQGKKVLGRLRHALRSRGVAVEEPPAKPGVASLPRLDDALRAAFVTPLDPIGARLAYLVLPNPAGGSRLFEVILDEVRGIVDCQVYTAARRDARRFLRDLAARDRLRAIEIPHEALQALVARIAARQPADRPLPRPFLDWRRELTGAPAGARTPGEQARASRPAGVAREDVERAAELVRKGGIGPWPPAEATLRAAAEGLREASRGRIVVSEVQKRERVEAALEEALVAVFDPDFAERTAERFEETAFVFEKNGEEADVRACVAAASLFRSGPPASNPVARAMLEVALGPVLAALREEESSSLLVKP